MSVVTPIIPYRFTYVLTALTSSAPASHALNSHYAAVSDDSRYRVPPAKHIVSLPCQHVTEMEVFRMLDCFKPTATGLDKLPAWFLRLGASVFAAPLAELFNQSINCGIVPQQWKKACITPIPKVAHPTVASDYRPISITSVLSRMLERRIVRTYCTSIQHCNSHHRDSTSPRRRPVRV